MTHNQSIEFLTENGWSYEKNRTARERFSRAVNEFEDEFEYVSMENALDLIRQENPEAFDEFSMIDNLDSKLSTLVMQYNED